MNEREAYNIEEQFEQTTSLANERGSFLYVCVGSQVKGYEREGVVPSNVPGVFSTTVYYAWRTIGGHAGIC
jgi:hypothetical protein